MNIIYLLAPLALLLGLVFAIGFILAARKGQFEDVETPAYRILLDDESTTSDRTKKGSGREH